MTLSITCTMHIYILVVGFSTKLFDLKLFKECENENPGGAVDQPEFE